MPPPSSPENSAPVTDEWARRERHPFTDESIWVGPVHVRVRRWRHWINWKLTGNPPAATSVERERIAAFVRLHGGIPPSHHEFVWITLWHGRTPYRGGLSTRRGGIQWEGNLHVASH